MALQNRHFPPITIDRHKEAVLKLKEERERHEIWIMPDGSRMAFSTGEIHMDDLRAEAGYSVAVSFGEHSWDRFGWPVGDDRSPETLYVDGENQ